MDGGKDRERAREKEIKYDVNGSKLYGKLSTYFSISPTAKLMVIMACSFLMSGAEYGMRKAGKIPAPLFECCHYANACISRYSLTFAVLR